uniref:Uncharacterized protein n=1 Tax=Amphora coffeiformis TaxID=265554 RepID=A0A7S3P1W0_9STRA
MPDTTPHIRPKVRRNNNSNAAKPASAHEPPPNNADPATAPPPQQQQPTTTASLPKSILRKPKYGGTKATTDTQQPLDNDSYYDDGEDRGATAKTREPQSAAVRDVVMERPRPKRNNKAKASSSHITTTTTTTPGVAAASTSIEGYTPKQQPQVDVATETPAPTTTTTTAAEKPRTKEEEALILNSLVDLMENAGMSLPDEGTTPLSEAAVVEADLQFSVMTPEEFDQYKEEQRRAQYEIFLGRPSIFQEPTETDKENAVKGPDEQVNPASSDETSTNSAMDADDDDDAVVTPENCNSDNEDDEDTYGDIFGDDGDFEDDEEVVEREPRAFLKLWSALSQWATPQAVRFIQSLRSLDTKESAASTTTTYEIQSAVDRSDVGASRCAGLMATVQRNFRVALEELGHDLEERRSTERLVGDLLRTFDYSLPSPPLDVAHAKAMTSILLQTVLYQPPLPDDNNESDGKCPATSPAQQVPPSCQNLGVTAEEFRYLTVSTIPNLAPPS